jgi:hypothetical protein
MEKSIKITIDGDKIIFEPSENLNNTDSLVMAVNLFEAIKTNMERELSPDNKPSLEEFIKIIINSLRKEENEETK